MNAAQSRMARAALKLGIRDVAKLAKVAPSTVSRLEAGEKLNPRTVEAIRRALEAAGVEFTEGDAPGVRVRQGR
jgi:transcriptional regulator with XRE-family HTH domain